MDPRADGRSCPASEFALLALPSFPLPGLMPTVHPRLIAAGKRRDCIRLRGLPYDASVNDIVTFLGDHSRQIVTQGVHLIYAADVRPSLLFVPKTFLLFPEAWPKNRVGRSDFFLV